MFENFPILNIYPRNTRTGLDNRDGVRPVTVWFAKVIVVCFATKVSISYAIYFII